MCRMGEYLNGLRRKIHFVGVGGIGMSGLAEILLNLGYEVSGTDLHASDITARLEAYGLRFHEGHDGAHIGHAEIVVVSAAVPEDNPEVVEARRRGLPVIHRADVLADLLRLKPNAVVVGGSHGKTTTTSMISAILDRANLGATSIVGGILHRSGTNARWGTGDYIVAESDEHDGSFLRLHPTIAVVTNIDAEHLEYYGTLDQIQRAFVDFCNDVPFYGYAIVCLDDANTREVLPRIQSSCITYGFSEGASLRASNAGLVGDASRGTVAQRLDQLRTRFEVHSHDERLPFPPKLGRIEIRALGDDNVRNATAACAVGLCLGLSFGHIADGLRDFSGVRRRLQLCGEAGGVTVVEDYAHHPTEIASTLRAARLLNPGRILVVFQPHLYTRTKFFSREFGEALAAADLALVTDIYGSRETPMPGVDAGLIVDSARASGHPQVELLRDKQRVPEFLAPQSRPGDLVLLMGAGNISQLAGPLLAALEARV
jgi:UDP-N-acetylmuramate--alanine ligase